MTGTNDVDRQILYFVKSGQHIWFERSKNTFVIIFKLLSVLVRIMHRRVKHRGLAVMRAQKVTGK
ncbi:hypothetical protein SDC9_176882 [bioreactor metagenome]|uniref:Uncharacterized protein n=1 Tax=bioreactor metagenome TaxID=1076179 RepID=A0A645GUJ3_9ZZZZ